MNPQIDERLNGTDNIELIRNQVGAILLTEMQNQYQLALDDEDPNADDYNAKIYIDLDEPLEALGEENNFPLVNIGLETVRLDGKVSVNNTTRKATLNLDCYQIGNYRGRYAGQTATTKAWRLANCVRAILESDQYTYLFLRGIVSQVSLVSMTSGTANRESSMKVSAVRIVVEVKFDENAPQSKGENFEILSVKNSDENGQIVIDIQEEEDA